ncbi:MAG: hypothetical protein J6B68_12495 [Lachnospiraceae bacterium]|nr:hypothetical protein [Lachnospiraceae bacterium]
MAGKDNYKIVNFRLNLEKKEEKELYDFLQSIDDGNLKNCYGSKSGFIKEILIAHMHGGVNRGSEITGGAGGFSVAGVVTAFTEDARAELNSVVKGALLECLDTLEVFVGAVASTDKGNATIMEPDKASSIPQQTDDIPDDAMDYLKELYG